MEYHFRTALNGFNRQEVVQYIEYITMQHKTELNQLTADLEFEKKKAESQDAGAVDALRAELSQKEEALESLKNAQAEKDAQIAALQESLEKAREEAEVKALEAEAKAQEAEAKAQEAEALRQTFSQQENKLAEMEKNVDEMKSGSLRKGAVTGPSRVIPTRTVRKETQEPHCDALERRAKVRADRLNQQSDRIVTQTTHTLEETAAQVEAAMQQVLEQCSALQQVLANSRDTIQNIGLDAGDEK